MHKEPLHGDDIFLIRDFLSPEECQYHITRTEAAGYDDAPISTGGGFVMAKSIRNNDRVMLDDIPLAAELFERAKAFLAVNFLIWRPVGLNERFRYYRYSPGQKFEWHYDGCFTRENGDSSKLTFMVYLSDGFLGGETVFNLLRLGKVEGEETLRVFPLAGTALVFRHDVLHTGAVVLQGTKYVLRTDVMFRHPDAAG